MRTVRVDLHARGYKLTWYAGAAEGNAKWGVKEREREPITVSYTHLTLPTIYSV